MKLPKKLQEIIDNFKLLDTNTEKYEELLQYGEELDEMPLEYKVSENLVPGCTSVVHIKSILKDDKLHFYGSSDSYLVKGLVAILVQGCSGMTPEEFLSLSPDFLVDLGLTETLSATRANASINIFNLMKQQTEELL